MAIDGVTAGTGVQGGGTSGNVPVELETPVSLQNGGTGVSVYSNTQLMNQIGAFPRAGGSMSGNLAVAGAIVGGNISTPNLGAGTILLNENTSATLPTLPAGGSTGLQIAGANGSGSRLLLDAFGSVAPSLLFRHGDGVATAMTPAAANENLGVIGFSGCAVGGTAFVALPAGMMVCKTTEAWSAAAQGSAIEFSTTVGTALGAKMTIQRGIVVGAPSGAGDADKGVGSINAQAIYVNGDPVGTGGTGLPLTGGTITAPTGTHDPLTIITDGGGAGGQSNRINFNILTNGVQPYSWAVGITPTGHFAIHNTTNNVDPLTIIGGNLPGEAATAGQVHINAGDLMAHRNVQVDGDLTVTGTYVPSDRRVKQNIAPWHCGLTAVRQLNPISFQYNGIGGMPADGRMRYGLDADNVDGAIPEMVGTLASREVDGIPVKSIAPMILIYALTNAVKELADRLDAIEGKLA